ncbi:hypothetical protein PM082_009835 [Marasmius tenuissimus]|nr:hypothetical protein PM082_009835 [Marasmius tenuissimus]
MPLFEAVTAFKVHPHHVLHFIPVGHSQRHVDNDGYWGASTLPWGASVGDVAVRRQEGVNEELQPSHEVEGLLKDLFVQARAAR